MLKKMGYVTDEMAADVRFCHPLAVDQIGHPRDHSEVWPDQPFGPARLEGQ
jgi:hypothetical protein